MSDKNEVMPNSYRQMLEKIGTILEEGRKRSYSAVNDVLIETYWNVGREIVEYEQKGKEKAEYGSALLDKLSKDLKARYGKGFSRRNVLDMRRLPALPKMADSVCRIELESLYPLIKPVRRFGQEFLRKTMYCGEMGCERT